MMMQGAKSQVGEGQLATGPFRIQEAEKIGQAQESKVHIYGGCVICDTDSRGFPTPKNRKPEELVLDASGGFIPLWAKGSVLRWRFKDSSMSRFEAPDEAKVAIEDLLGKAILAWGDAVPVKFAKSNDDWDFEVVIREADRCSVSGCVLASAFFPDSGRHELVIYPQMLMQSQKEQVETLVHEIGHIFGLRHFFADIRETDWPSEIFGEHSRFTIMNYGVDSELTPQDQSDLKKLYRMVWSGELQAINGTPVRLVTPFHTLGESVQNM